MNTSKKWIRNSAKIFKVFEDQVYILDDESENLVTLNQTGSLLWLKLESACTTSQLAVVVIQKFEVSQKQAEVDIKKFISKMSKLGLVLQKNKAGTSAN